MRISGEPRGMKAVSLSQSSISVIENHLHLARDSLDSVSRRVTSDPSILHLDQELCNRLATDLLVPVQRLLANYANHMSTEMLNEAFQHQYHMFQEVLCTLQPDSCSTNVKMDEDCCIKNGKPSGGRGWLSSSRQDEPSLEPTRRRTVDWNALADEVLRQGVFSKLPLFDLLRARAVCKRWQDIAAQALISFDISLQEESTSYCPLVFRRNSLQHLWCGYDSAAGAWELLPSLTNLPQVDIRPLAGNGKYLMGFKITTMPSQLVVGNPLTSEWQTIPKSTETWGEVGNVLVVDRSTTTSAAAATFRIIAVQEDATEIFHSEMEVWAKLRQRPPPGLQEVTVLCMKDKFITSTLCGNMLFCYGGGALVAFDVVAERWTEDHIRLPPHASSKCFQMLECGGALFAVIENVTGGTIAVWGLGLRRREFVHVGEMPAHLYAGLCKKAKSKGRKQAQVQLKAVGHKHRMYFWRNFGHYIVEFQQLRREWKELPQFDECLGNATDPDVDPADAFQTFVDTGSFEP